MRKKFFLVAPVFIAILGWAVLLCFAQTQGRDATKNYIISSNAVLGVTVYGEPDLSVTVRVSQDGSITYPLLGNIKVAGLTVRQAEQIIADLLGKDYLVNPQVSIFVKEYARVSILGQVRNPGSYEVKDNLALTQAIAIAGGFTESADVNKVKIIRTENNRKETLSINVAKIIEKSAPDTEIKANDVIMVEGYGRVSIMGQVKKPGTYEVKDNLALTQAIAMAGGFTESADVNKVKIIRTSEDKKEAFEVDLQQLINGEAPDIDVNPDDTIIVEEQKGRISVMGQVARPGVYILKRDLTVVEAISLAGGFTSTAAIDGTRVIRGRDGQKEVIRVRMSDIIKGVDKSRDIVLQDGDTIVVPESFF
jgi:polysaccharide export outer membrane protein